MKNYTKKATLFFLSILVSKIIFAQADAAGIGGHLGLFPTWYCGWNAATPFPLTIAHKGNQPMIFQTNNTQRIFIANTAGGVYGNVGIGTMFNTITRPFSNLHIQQDNNNFSFGGGFRPWMQPSAPGTYSGGTGISISNGDNIFLGLQNKGGVFDQNDAILNWGDNGGTAVQGADFFRFLFTNWNPAAPGGGVQGLEIMRMAPNSNVGIGDFHINGQFNPQSKLHMHEDITLHPGGGRGQSIWFQMTNHDFAAAPTPFDGLKIGLLYQPQTLQTGNAFIYQQENRHLIFSTAHDVPDGAGTIDNTLERMRITCVGAPTTLPGTGYGVYNPGPVNNLDFTRISVSHNPANPVTRPLSLLHLGYNTPGTGITPDLGGWRSWMDVGTFTNQNFGTLGGMSLYSGLKVSPLPNVAGEAILSWGYNPTTSTFPPIPTRMRFLFTTNASTVTVAGGTNGIQAAHFWSDGNNTRMGVGDLQTANVDPQNTLEIRSSAASPYFITNNASGLRFTNLTSSDVTIPNGTNGVISSKVLTVDGNGDVVLTTSTAGGLGHYCGQPVNNLSGDYGIPLNTHSFNFYGPGQVGVGDIVCNYNSPARFFVRNTFSGSPSIGLMVSHGSTALNQWAGYFQGNINVAATPYFLNAPIIYSDKHIKENIVTIDNPLAIIGKLNPVRFNYNTTSYAPQLTSESGNQYGFIAQEVENLLPELVRDVEVKPRYDTLGNPIDSIVMLKGLRYDALIPFAIGGIQQLNTKQQQMQEQLDKAGLSDAQVKTDVVSFNALSKIKQLSPVSYHFTNANVPQLTFNNTTDYGFVAQQMAGVYPELVDSVEIPETTDSLGNIVNPATILKTVNYKAMSALLTRAVQEQQFTIDSLKHSQDSINNAVQNQLAQLTSLINSCCQNNARTQSANVIDIQLSDKDIIILNQNVPNPFAEQTTITYNIPEKSGFAQIIFSDMKGQVIKVADIKTKGNGQLNVFANDLSSGMYSYTLYVDGKAIDTKKMVKTE